MRNETEKQIHKLCHEQTLTSISKINAMTPCHDYPSRFPSSHNSSLIPLHFVGSTIQEGAEWNILGKFRTSVTT